MTLLLADFPAPTKDEAWPVLITIFAILGIVAKVMEIWKHSRGTKVHGTIQSETVPKLAEQEALDAVAKSVDSLREEITGQFRAAQTAGENRVAAITQDVNTEMGTLSIKIGEITKMITTALIDNGTQGEAINNLKATTRNHEQSIAAIHRRIDDVLQQRGKRPS